MPTDLPEQMRHAREIGKDRLAADVLAERDRQVEVRLLEGLRAQHLAQEDGLALGVRQLDADGVAALHHSDAGRDGAHRARNVISQADDAGGLDAGRGFEFVERHHGARPHLQDLALHAEIVEHALKHAGILFQGLIREFRGLADALGLRQQGEWRHLIFVRGSEREARLQILAKPPALFHRLVAARHARGRRFRGLVFLSVFHGFVAFGFVRCGLLVLQLSDGRRGTAEAGREDGFDAGGLRRAGATPRLAMGLRG